MNKSINKSNKLVVCWLQYNVNYNVVVICCLSVDVLYVATYVNWRSRHATRRRYVTCWAELSWASAEAWWDTRRDTLGYQRTPGHILYTHTDYRGWEMWTLRVSDVIGTHLLHLHLNIHCLCQAVNLLTPFTPLLLHAVTSVYKHTRSSKSFGFIVTYKIN